MKPNNWECTALKSPPANPSRIRGAPCGAASAPGQEAPSTSEVVATSIPAIASATPFRSPSMTCASVAVLRPTGSPRSASCSVLPLLGRNAACRIFADGGAAGSTAAAQFTLAHGILPNTVSSLRPAPLLAARGLWASVVGVSSLPRSKSTGPRVREVSNSSLRMVLYTVHPRSVSSAPATTTLGPAATV